MKWIHRGGPAEILQFLLRIALPVLILFILYTSFLRSKPGPAPEPATIVPPDFRFPLPLDRAFHSNPAGLAGICVLIAFLTYAFVQILKAHSDMRLRVHRIALDEWLRRRLSLRHFPTRAGESELGSRDDREVKDAWYQIEDLCAAGTAGDEDFYRLPTAQFCGQIGSAVDLVLIQPSSYEALFAALTSGARPDHYEAVQEFFTMAGQPPTERSAELDRYDRLRARISNYAQRALDGLQFEATQRWRSKIMQASIQASLGISLAIVLIVAPPAKASDLFLFAYSTVVCAGAGALLAPIAYDIVSGIRAFGRR
jgi:hypothetical protein